MEVKSFQVRIKDVLVYILLQHLLRSTRIALGLTQGKLHAIVDLLIIGNVTVAKGIVRRTTQMLQPAICQLLIGTAFLNRVLVVAVERGGIHQIDKNLAGAVHQNGITIGLNIGTLDLNLGAETHTSVGVIRDMILTTPIAGQGGIGNIAFVDQHLTFLGTNLILKLTRYSHTGTDSLGIICGDTDDNT